MALQEFQPRDLSDPASRLMQLTIGSSAMFGGLIVHREAEHSFHLQHAGEAMFGNAATVVDWIKQLRKPCASARFPTPFPAKISAGKCLR